MVWQVQRDLLDRAPRTWQATRRRVAKEGWGARLLAKRASDGMWGGGLYQPKWTSTFYTLRLLMHLGVAPNHRQAIESCKLMLDAGVKDMGGVSLWRSGSTDTCVTAMLLQMACYFGFGETEPCERMKGWLLDEQMDDGGWNCSKGRGATHSSFHTTISTLEGFAALPAGGRSRKVSAAKSRAEEFFFEHQLYRSSTTGEVVRSSFAQLSFPPRWFFDVLRGLEYFRQVDAAWDSRLADPVGVVEKRQRKDGKWNAQNHHTGLRHFKLEESRQPSRMNTLRALRVLRWVEQVRA